MIKILEKISSLFSPKLNPTSHEKIDPNGDLTIKEESRKDDILRDLLILRRVSKSCRLIGWHLESVKQNSVLFIASSEHNNEEVKQYISRVKEQGKECVLVPSRDIFREFLWDNCKYLTPDYLMIASRV